MNKPVFLGSTIFIMILNSYLSFHSAILNNATCIASRDMETLSRPLNRSQVYAHSRIGYRPDIDSPFPSVTFVWQLWHEAKCLATTRKARPSLVQPSLPLKSFTYRKKVTGCCFEEAQSYIANLTRKQTKVFICFLNRWVI